MPSNINGDAIFGIHADAMRLHRQRMEMIASNLANADTPNFQASDLDFQAALAKAAGEAGGLATTNAGHIGTPGAADGNAAVVHRQPNQNSLDGNSVDVQREQAAFADSAVHYQASMMFAENRIRSLLTAISGE
ncbi:MAG TPA: flagellar basal body rod protein FlgB [Nevskiaceae bacterium]|nr:flagellar basal body rod protein FlgB [Nevskiaceae bacterium]